MSENKKPGVYIRFYKKGAAGDTPLAMVPCKGNISVENRNSFHQPIKKLYEFLGNTASSTIGLFFGSGAANALNQVSNLATELFGIRLYHQSYFAQAWKESLPPTFSVTLDFFLGMNDEYNAESEVYTPLKNLHTSTLPELLGTFIFSAQVTGAEVFKAYGSQVIDNLISRKESTSVEGGTSRTLEDEADVDVMEQRRIAENQTSSNSLEFVGQRGTYGLQYRYIDSGGNWSAPILSLAPLVVENCQVEFSPETDSRGYPISGSATLTLIAQEIFTRDTDLFR